MDYIMVQKVIEMDNLFIIIEKDAIGLSEKE